MQFGDSFTRIPKCIAVAGTHCALDTRLRGETSETRSQKSPTRSYMSNAAEDDGWRFLPNYCVGRGGGCRSFRLQDSEQRGRQKRVGGGTVEYMKLGNNTHTTQRRVFLIFISSRCLSAFCCSGRIIHNRIRLICSCSGCVVSPGPGLGPGRNAGQHL